MSNAEPTDPATPPEDLAVPAVADEPESRPGGVPLYVWVIRGGRPGDSARAALGRRRNVPGNHAPVDPARPDAHRRLVSRPLPDHIQRPRRHDRRRAPRPRLATRFRLTRIGKRGRIVR